jgi:antitoxin PrlF
MSGHRVQIDKLANGVLALHAKPTHGLSAFAGCLPPPAKALSIEEMNAVIADGWAQQSAFVESGLTDVVP